MVKLKIQITAVCPSKGQCQLIMETASL